MDGAREDEAVPGLRGMAEAAADRRRWRQEQGGAARRRGSTPAAGVGRPQVGPGTTGGSRGGGAGDSSPGRKLVRSHRSENRPPGADDRQLVFPLSFS